MSCAKSAFVVFFVSIDSSRFFFFDGRSSATSMSCARFLSGDLMSLPLVYVYLCAFRTVLRVIERYERDSVSLTCGREKT